MFSVLQDKLFLDTEFQKDVECCTNLDQVLRANVDGGGLLLTVSYDYPPEEPKAWHSLWVEAVRIRQMGNGHSLGSHLSMLFGILF